MKQLTEEEILAVKKDLTAPKTAVRRSAAKKISRYGLTSLSDDLLEAYLRERVDVRTWETQTEMIKAFGKTGCMAALPYLKEIIDMNKEADTITVYAALSYIRLTREFRDDMSITVQLLRDGSKSVFMGAVYAIAYDDVLPDENSMKEILIILDKERAVYNDPYTYAAQPVISMMSGWPKELITTFLEHYRAYPQFEDFIANTLSGKKSVAE